MFHDGDLQSGIALAIQQAKSVACFVRDESSESSEWESTWMQEDGIAHLLSERAVTLRIQAGSQEAGFLNAFCPVDKVPALAVIHNGRLVDLIVKGTTREEFTKRIRKALGAEETKPVERQSTAATPNNDAAHPIATAPVQVTPSSTAKAKGKQKQEGDDPPPATPAEQAQTAADARNNWLEQQRQRQSDAKRERERVMAQIEADKAERRARREQEKKDREQAAQQQESPISNASPAQKSSVRKATYSNLQVRLLDGGTIRKQFPADASLEVDVRPWVDTHLETKAPYTFKQILAPQPARPITISEEQSSLRDLDLLPSATLVLQPVQTYTEAYDQGAGSGIIATGYNTFGLISGTLRSTANWLRGGLFRPEENLDVDGRLLGNFSPADEQQQSSPAGDARRDANGNTLGSAPPANASANSNARGSSSNVRIRTLADQRDGAAEDQQFYNGNSLDFESNDDKSTRK